jgi:hypothetical protein
MIVTFSYCYAECHSVECHSTECHGTIIVSNSQLNMKYFIILKDINNHCLTGPIKWLNVYAVTQTNMIRALLKGAQSLGPSAVPQH